MMNPMERNGRDELLDRELARLGRFSPRTGLEESVMAQVMRPAPRWVQRLKRRHRMLVETRKIWWLLGGLAGTSAVSASIVVGLVLANAAAVGAFVRASVHSVGLPIWRATLGIVTDLARDIYALVGSAAISSSAVITTGGFALAALAANALLLYRLMHPAAPASVELNATR
ncbi:MAG: hypothetical protein ACE5HT_05830 [Gemmatimonadales bacterium]